MTMIMIDKAVVERALEALCHGIAEMHYVPADIDYKPLQSAANTVREALDHLVQPGVVGSLSVRYYLGCKSMTNTDFEYSGNLPEGDYELCIAPQAHSITKGNQ